MARSGGPRKPRLPITRTSVEGEFVFRLDGKKIRRKAELARLNSMAIPPAWNDVRVATSPRAKIMARGIDAAGREQTIYGHAYRRKMERKKFRRMVRFANALPRLRARVDRDLRRRKLTEDLVVACIIRLMDQQFFRVGNREYARRHASYGLTTLRTEHISLDEHSVVFDFTGKSGKRHRKRVRDPQIVRILKQLFELPEPELFRFLDDEKQDHPVGSSHVNAYVQRHMGKEFSAKDFRTWGGTVLAVAALLTLRPEELGSPARVAATRARVLREVAEQLGNTPAVTKSAYIDPRILQIFDDPEAVDRLRKLQSRTRERRYLSVEERCTLAILGTRDSAT
ncbi:MAG: DNA topoisomerase IB [Leucobacter sp.]